ncbi:trypsin-like peptidase domain-containing protein [Oscillibacter sp.]|uniref:S1C family serine protease n=1 Tax=Oscillibacter sp. TaxID=1945593 RepID=UPI00289DA9FF|nr:trypsin-like peptidase domain-containing protein [Oscillibacter sp.]
MNDQFFKIQHPDEQSTPPDGEGGAPVRADPREVVEYYPPQPQPREVVELYVQPRRLPGRAEPPVPPNSAPAIGPILTSPVSKKRVHGRRGLWIFLVCLAVAGGLAVGAFFLNGGFFYFDPSSPKDEYLQNEDWDQEEVSIETYPYGEGAVMELTAAPSGALSIQEIYRRVNPAVVTVIAQLDRGASVGTGMIFRENGYVLTNYHVVAGSHDCSVTLASGRTYEALYVGGDSGNDVAVLKLEATGLPAAEMGDSDALMVGDTVYAIGNPLGVELRGTLTDGIVSAINRDVDVSGRTMTLIQTNAALNEGNSGGPLINVYGQVVGVNTIKMMSFSSNVEGLGFALPMRSVQKMVNDILESGEVLPEPRLGVTIFDMPKVLPDGTQGVEVQDVGIGSAADRAGVKAGDVIVSAGGQAVTERHMLLNVRRQFRIGDDLPMKLWRDGEYLEVVLRLDEAFEELPAE